jgi:HEPN domain-containing protein
MNRNELRSLSRIRMREAKSLFQVGHFSGAYYLAGYSLECALKACIARNVQRYDFPDRNRVNDSYTHDPLRLVKTAELETALNADMVAEPNLATRWALARNWSEQSRYKTFSQADAAALIEALTNARYGVLRWIRQRW